MGNPASYQIVKTHRCTTRNPPALIDVRLEAPVRRPGKVIAAPLNYENHIEEAIADKDITTEEWFSIKDKGYFLKAPSSVIRPDDTIELPFDDRHVDHESNSPW